jgi:hypothetical protein
MSPLFIRNENGRGFRATKTGAAFLRVWDISSWIVFALFFGTLLTQDATPWWLFVVATPFAIAPLFMMMFFTGLGPFGALMHYARRRNTGGNQK